MTTNARRFLGSFAFAAALAVAATSALAQNKVRIAIGETGIEAIPYYIALERAKEKGVDYELTTFAQGGPGDPGDDQRPGGYRHRARPTRSSRRPRRRCATLSRSAGWCSSRWPTSRLYKDWKALNGQPFTFHARGSGTEAIGNIIAKREGIEFGQRSYVPGSENRVVAHAQRPDQGDHPRSRQQEPPDGEGRRPLPRAAGRRRRPASDEVLFVQRRLDGEERRRRRTSSSRSSPGCGGRWREPGDHRAGARQARAAEGPAQGGARRSVTDVLRRWR